MGKKAKTFDAQSVLIDAGKKYPKYTLEKDGTQLNGRTFLENYNTFKTAYLRDHPIAAGESTTSYDETLFKDFSVNMSRQYPGIMQYLEAGYLALGFNREILANQSNDLRAQSIANSLDKATKLLNEGSAPFRAYANAMAEMVYKGSIQPTQNTDRVINCSYTRADQVVEKFKGGDDNKPLYNYLKSSGFTDSQIAMVQMVGSAYGAQVDGTNSSMGTQGIDQIGDRLKPQGVTLGDFKNYVLMMNQLSENKLSGPLKNFLIGSVETYLTITGDDPSAFLNTKLKKADAGLDTGDAVADAGGPESDPTGVFRAAGTAMTTSAAADPAAPAVTRRPDAPATAPA